jgi:hypothetical protein
MVTLLAGGLGAAVSGLLRRNDVAEILGASSIRDERELLEYAEEVCGGMLVVT